MLEANLNKVLLGSTIQLNWNCEELRFKFFLYLKKSHKLSRKDRKLTRIGEKGSVNVTVTDRNFECHLRKFTLFGWKTLASYKPQVFELHVETPDLKIMVPRANLNKRPNVLIKLFPPKIKQLGLQVILPQAPVIDYDMMELDNDTISNKSQRL